jgi:hypothetical protein
MRPECFVAQACRLTWIHDLEDSNQGEKGAAPEYNSGYALTSVIGSVYSAN